MTAPSFHLFASGVLGDVTESIIGGDISGDSAGEKPPFLPIDVLSGKG